MQKGAMDYFSDLERAMEAKGIVYEANIWDYKVPVYDEAAVDITEDLDGNRVVRVTAMDGREIPRTGALPVNGVIMSIKRYGMDVYKDVEPILEVDLIQHRAHLDTADLYSVGKEYYADMLKDAIREITSEIGFSLER